MTRAVSRLFQSLIKYPCGRIGLRKQNLIAMSKLAAKQNLISSRDCHSCFIFSIILMALKNPQREHSSFHLSDRSNHENSLLLLASVRERKLINLGLYLF